MDGRMRLRGAPDGDAPVGDAPDRDAPGRGAGRNA